MNKKNNWLVLFVFVSLILSWAFAEEPFWKEKPHVYKKIKEERAIIVSAKTIKDEQNKRKIVLMAAGRIHAPLYFTHQEAIKYDEYGKILPYVDEVSFDKKESRLTAKGSFMGLHAKSVFTLKDSEEKNKAFIKWEVYSGFLTGMSGVITEEKVGDDTTEISMEASYSGNLELPAFLLNWGFEFIGQKMAQAMRSHVEDKWNK